MAGFLNQQVTDRWAIYNGDSMDMLAGIPDDSIHGSIYACSLSQWAFHF